MMRQVSLLHLSFRAPGLNSSGFPDFSRISFRCPGSPMTFPGQPRSASSGFTGDRVASFPASRILLRYLPRLAECPRRRLACLADDVSPSILGHRILRFQPAIELRVSPPLISFSVSGCPTPGVPETGAPPATPLMSPRASPGTTSSGCADGDRTGRPALSCPPAMPIGGSPGSPGFRAFRPFRIRFPGLPRLCGYGWVNDVSPPSLELCICCYPACDSPGVPASCARWLCRG